MMYPQVFISGLILLLPGALGTYTVVEGVVGQPVTLPCTYSTNGGVTTACWGLGECRSAYCTRTLIWTDGHRVSYKRSSRYQLKGHISKGNVSLTIENAIQSDSGPYCCIVEIPGSFRYVTYSLEIKPEISTIPPIRPTTARGYRTTGRPTTAGRHTTTGRPTTTDARRSYKVVEGVVGHPVTLPCTYSTNGGVTTACWGLGECQSAYCARTLIWTNGYQVSYKRSNRYQLKGHISKGNVSLTIENAVQSDSGPYCCIVEIPGSFRYVNYSLEIKPEISTSTPTRPTTAGRYRTTGIPTTAGGHTTTRRPTTTGRLTTPGRPTISRRPTLQQDPQVQEDPLLQEDPQIQVDLQLQEGLQLQ